MTRYIPQIRQLVQQPAQPPRAEKDGVYSGSRVRQVARSRLGREWGRRLSLSLAFSIAMHGTHTNTNHWQMASRRTSGDMCFQANVIDIEPLSTPSWLRNERWTKNNQVTM